MTGGGQIRFLIAYVDPGTGSFALQAVIGSIMGISYMARNQIRSLMGKLKRETPAQKPDKE